MKYKKELPFTYVNGTTLVIELLKTRPKAAIRLYINPSQKRDATYDKLLSLAKNANVPVIENNLKIFKEASEKDNVMAIAEIKKETTSLDKEANHVVLVNPSNQGNLGTIIRAMVGFSIFDLAIIKPAADCFDPKCIRASMGAFFHTHIEYFESFDEYMAKYERKHIYPFMLQANEELREKKIFSPYTLVFGNEAKGLPQEFLQIGDPLIIPQSKIIDSLNLDNAVSIALYEFKMKGEGR